MGGGAIWRLCFVAFRASAIKNHKEIMMERLPGCLLLLWLLSGAAWSEGRFIAVEGKGEIEMVPDIIRVSYSVFEVSENLVAAKAKVEETSAQSVKSMLKLGVAEKDITSSSLSVDTARNYSENGGMKILGHSVQRDIEVVLRDITFYGPVIQALVDSQVSEITDIKADISNEEELKRKALVKAAQNAQANARFLAEQFGAELDKVRQIGKQNLRREFDLEEVVVTAQRRKSASIKSVPYEFKPGTVKVSSQVYVEFDLK